MWSKMIGSEVTIIRVFTLSIVSPVSSQRQVYSHLSMHLVPGSVMGPSFKGVAKAKASQTLPVLALPLSTLIPLPTNISLWSAFIHFTDSFQRCSPSILLSFTLFKKLPSFIYITYSNHLTAPCFNPVTHSLCC